MRVEALAQCHPDCPFCARDFFAWYARRMGAMNVRKNGILSFSEAAATSIRPAR